ncbi:MAG: MBL fold metallo-hydrolase [Burkholderiaceae bacterium]
MFSQKKRRLKNLKQHCLLIAGFLCFSILPVTVQAAGYEPVSVNVIPKQLAPGVWVVQGLPGVASSANQGFNSNAGFVVTDDGVVVFDSLGTPSLGAELIQQIKKITNAPIKRLIISHYHSDHFYGAQAFQDAGVPITAQEWVVSHYLKSNAPVLRLAERRNSLFPWVNEGSRITPPDHTFQSEEIFVLGELTFRVFHTGPAHTPEDSMMIVEQAGVLFAGDLVFSGRLPWVGDADSRAWLSALEKIQDFKPRYLVPGHGTPSANAAKDIALTREYLSYLRKAMGQAVEELLEFDEAYDQTDWSRFAGLPTFKQANRTNAYNTFLLMQRESLGGK